MSDRQSRSRSTRPPARELHDLLFGWARARARASSSPIDIPKGLAQALVTELDHDEREWLREHLQDLGWCLDGALDERDRADEKRVAAEVEAKREDLVELETQGGATTYQLEGRACGKDNCKCARGRLHGPYWYAYRRENGRLKKEYIGKTLSGVPSRVRRKYEARYEIAD